jgi:hypothetical protein
LAAISPEETAAVDAVAAGLRRFNTPLDQEFVLIATDRAAALKISAGQNRDLRKAYEAGSLPRSMIIKGRSRPRSKSSRPRPTR